MKAGFLSCLNREGRNIAPLGPMFRKLYRILDERILKHFRKSHAPAREIALASAVGLFWALTPLVGIQMTLVAVTWVLFRIVGLRFNLPLGAAWVWITNPLTMPFFYYSFYMLGVYSFQFLGFDVRFVTFESFNLALAQGNALGFWEGASYWVKFMAVELGWPMLIGSFVMGLPIAILGYPLTARLLNSYRSKLAARHNLTLAEWEDVYVHKTRPKPDANSDRDATPKVSAPSLLADTE